MSSMYGWPSGCRSINEVGWASGIEPSREIEILDDGYAPEGKWGAGRDHDGNSIQVYGPEFPCVTRSEEHYGPGGKWGLGRVWRGGSYTPRLCFEEFWHHLDLKCRARMLDRSEAEFVKARAMIELTLTRIKGLRGHDLAILFSNCRPEQFARVLQICMVDRGQPLDPEPRHFSEIDIWEGWDEEDHEDHEETMRIPGHYPMVWKPDWIGDWIRNARGGINSFNWLDGLEWSHEYDEDGVPQRPIQEFDPPDSYLVQRMHDLPVELHEQIFQEVYGQRRTMLELDSFKPHTLLALNRQLYEEYGFEKMLSENVWLVRPGDGQSLFDFACEAPPKAVLDKLRKVEIRLATADLGYDYEAWLEPYFTSKTDIELGRDNLDIATKYLESCKEMNRELIDIWQAKLGILNPLHYLDDLLVDLTEAYGVDGVYLGTEIRASLQLWSDGNLRILAPSKKYREQIEDILNTSRLC